MALISTASAACGPFEKVSAGTKVQRGFQKLGERKALTAEFRISANEKQIWSALKNTKGFRRDYAKIMAGLRLSVWSAPDKPVKDVFKDPEANVHIPSGYAFAVDGGQPVVDVRSDGKKMYQRMDFQRLAKLTPQGSANLARQKGELDKLPSPLKEMTSGQWVAYDVKDFEEFAKKKQPGPGAGPATQLKVEDQKKVMDAFEKAFIDNADLKDAGSKGGADHVTATVPAKKAMTTLAKGLEPIAEKNPSLGSLKGSVEDVPEKDIALDIAIKDGAVSELTLDLAQFADDDQKVDGELPLSIELKGEAPAFEAPSGAKVIKPKDLERAVREVQSAERREAGRGADSDSTGGSSAEIEQQLEKMRKLERENPSPAMTRLRRQMEDLLEMARSAEARQHERQV
ncbi:hypothetical protein K2224_37255 (plasmid) [Streptomyces sp. BHT-5-2]|uniref:hypothetical protein n=1 Tax=Streptomyces sp. BHT-5-2 TaxID=2866715 RepID=UPI001C8E5545|nr:hypothetical protein [Streptomyces sp. BHT-5-2]QZL08702.1 hypothetical protein K2224_37255 [Streptomyces sp. BHT-5-2]